MHSLHDAGLHVLERNERRHIAIGLRLEGRFVISGFRFEGLLLEFLKVDAVFENFHLIFHFPNDGERRREHVRLVVEQRYRRRCTAVWLLLLCQSFAGLLFFFLGLKSA